MILDESDLQELVAAMRAGPPLKVPTSAVVSFAERAGSLGPRALTTEGEALLRQGEDAEAVAQVVIGALEGLLGDLGEHGRWSEFAEDETFLRETVATWSKRAGCSRLLRVLLAKDLEQQVVALVPHAKLPTEEAAAWATLRDSRRLVDGLDAILAAPRAPWFAELVAAFIGREVAAIAAAARGASWKARLDEVPELLAHLRKLGTPPIFGPRVLRAANMVVLRHAHEPTRRALEQMGALGLSEADTAKVKQARMMAEAMARATKGSQKP